MFFVFILYYFYFIVYTIIVASVFPPSPSSTQLTPHFHNQSPTLNLPHNVLLVVALSMTVCIRHFKALVESWPVWLSWLECLLELKGHGFDSPSGHMPRLWFSPQSGHIREATNQCFSLTWSFSPSLSPFPFLKSISMSSGKNRYVSLLSFISGDFIN